MRHMALQRLVMGIAAPIATKNFTMGAETLHICCRSNLSAPIDFVNIAERSANDGLIEKSRLFSIAAIKSPPYLADS